MTFDKSSSNSGEKRNEEDESGAALPSNSSYSPRSAISSFNLEEMSERPHIAFTELYHTDKFQQTLSFREHIYLMVDYMRTDGLSILFRELVIIFGVSKETIVEHYQPSLVQHQKAGQLLFTEGDAWRLYIISCLTGLRPDVL
jgi:hypothetical protein